MSIPLSTDLSQRLDKQIDRPIAEMCPVENKEAEQSDALRAYIILNLPQHLSMQFNESNMANVMETNELTHENMYSRTVISAKKFLKRSDKLLSILGVGGYGVVFLVQKRNGTRVAVKMARGERDSLEREMHAHEKFAEAGLAPRLHEGKLVNKHEKSELWLSVMYMDTIEYTLHQLLCSSWPTSTCWFAPSFASW